jgi:uncharacterized heparinase superfamily protein
MSFANQLVSLRRLTSTLADVGPKRLQRRIRYELRLRLDRRLPPPLALAWAGATGPQPEWCSVTAMFAGDALVSPPMQAQPLRVVRFNFLNQERQLQAPISWNDPQWPRLWQFHLHYFDWARQWLDNAVRAGSWPAEASVLPPLLDSWITSNPPGRGDGWHSYTLSLRTRNWIALFLACPALATPERLQSLWQQLCWLQAHPEHCHGGNHWLENLTALAVGGLQFGGPQASRMYRRAMRLLQRELMQQVLGDGGHEERSASYHLLMLVRLAELAHALHATTGAQPPWLVEAIEAMTKWVKLVRLDSGEAPRFNDSAADTAPPLDAVLAFATAPQQQRSASAEDPLSQEAISDLPDTGWTFLRPGHGWELVFKCGVPCPKHLPPHVHSDQLSFELCHQGRWLLSEAGTSVYGNGPERVYERSGASHNVLQLGVETPSGAVRWIEPIDVWGGFRAGRKAQPRERACGHSNGGVYFAAGSHSGFDHIGASHHRRVTLSDPKPSQISLHLVDTVIAPIPLHVRQWWHLGPEVRQELLEPLLFDAPSLAGAQTSWHTTWFAKGFGQRLPRQSLCFSGSLPAGKHQLSSSVSFSLHQPTSKACRASG